MSRKISCLIFVVFLGIIFFPYSVFAKAEVYDVVLFFGQSNMTGYAGVYDTEKVKDSRLTNLGVDSFSSSTGIDKQILNKYTKMNHVDVDIAGGTAYEYIYASNSMREIKSSTEVLGENLEWNTSTNKPVACDRKSLFASQESYGTNIIPQFAKSYYEATGRKIVAVMVSNGGEEIAHFLPHNKVGTYSKGSNTDEQNQYIYETMVAKYKAAISYMNNNTDKYIVGKKMYVVFQGESDVKFIQIGTMTSQNYYDVFMLIHNGLASDLGIQYGGIIETAHRTGVVGFYNGVTGIHSAQKSLIDRNSNIFLASSYPYDHYVPDESNYSGSNFGTDLEKSLLSTCMSGDNDNRIHFNSAALSQIGMDSALASVKQLNKNVNWLDSLTINDENISVGNKTSFEINVDNSIQKVNIGANTYHTGLTFVDGFGPREVNLEEGKNTVQLKIKYGSEQKVYTIVINRAEKSQEQEEEIVVIDTPKDEKAAPQVVKVPDTLARQSIISLLVSGILILLGIIVCLFTNKIDNTDNK